MLGGQFVSIIVWRRSLLRVFHILTFSEFSSKDKEAKRKEMDVWVCWHMTEEGCHNDVVFGLFKTCIASLVFHQEFLDEMLHLENAMHCSAF